MLLNVELNNNILGKERAALLKITDDEFIEVIGTRAERAKALKPCPIGSEGACCRTCYVGPCRFVGKNAEEEVRGVCASTLGVVASRQFLTMCASGSAIHAARARESIDKLLEAAENERRIYDKAKLNAVADLIGVGSAKKTKTKLAKQIADEYLSWFYKYPSTVLNQLPSKRLNIWKECDLLPRGIDREIAESTYNASVGVNYDVEDIMMQAARVSIANGWFSSAIVADIEDITENSTTLYDSKLSGIAENYWNKMVGGYGKAPSLNIVGELISSGDIRGIACLIDCDHPRYEESSSQRFISLELIKNDILVVTGGCNNTLENAGLLSPDTVMQVAGRKLKKVYENTGIPPVISLGGCISHSRILNVLSALVKENAIDNVDDINGLPCVILAPHWFSGTAISIGCFYAVSGVETIFGGKSLTHASKEVTQILENTWKQKFGASFRFVDNAIDMVEAVLDHMDAVRKNSGLVSYYP